MRNAGDCKLSIPIDDQRYRRNALYAEWENTVSKYKCYGYRYSE